IDGAVGDNVTVQHSNSATDPLATSGDASLVNRAFTASGPQVDGPGQASQFGDNTMDLTQDGNAQTGDAVSGSQVAGVVGGGQHVVQLMNSSDCGRTCSRSGDALVVNSEFSGLGPDVFTFNGT